MPALYYKDALINCKFVHIYAGEAEQNVCFFQFLHLTSPYFCPVIKNQFK